MWWCVLLFHSYFLSRLYLLSTQASRKEWYWWNNRRKTITNVSAKNFAVAADIHQSCVSIPTAQIQSYCGMLTIKGVTSKSPHSSVITSQTKNRIIIYKSFDVTNNKIANLAEEKIKKCVGQIWKDVEYLSRGKKYTTVEIRVWSAEKT